MELPYLFVRHCGGGRCYQRSSPVQPESKEERDRRQPKQLLGSLQPAIAAAAGSVQTPIYKAVLKNFSSYLSSRAVERALAEGIQILGSLAELILQLPRQDSHSHWLLRIWDDLGTL